MITVQGSVSGYGRRATEGQDRRGKATHDHGLERAIWSGEELGASAVGTADGTMTRDGNRAGLCASSEGDQQAPAAADVADRRGPFGRVRGGDHCVGYRSRPSGRVRRRVTRRCHGNRRWRRYWWRALEYWAAHWSRADRRSAPGCPDGARFRLSTGPSINGPRQLITRACRSTQNLPVGDRPSATPRWRANRDRIPITVLHDCQHAR